MIRIAIIDDEPRQRRGMEQLIIALRPEAEVLAFRNAKEALEALRVQPAQIIFSDIRMPHMTGLDLAQRVHERMPNTLVILISAYSEFEYAHKAIELGVFSYLLKPIQPEAVRAVLDKALERLEQRRREEAIIRMRDACLSERQQRLFQVWLSGELSAQQYSEMDGHLLRDEGGRLIRVILPDPADTRRQYSAAECDEIYETLTQWLLDTLEPAHITAAITALKPYTLTAAVFSGEDPEQKLAEYQRLCREDYGFAPDLLVGGYWERLDEQVRQACEQLTLLEEYRFYFGSGALIRGERLPPMPDEVPAVDERSLEETRQAVLAGNEESVTTSLSALVRHGARTRPLPRALKDQTILILLRLRQSVRDVHAPQGTETFDNELLALRDVSTCRELIEQACGLAVRLCALCREAWKQSSPLPGVLRYLETHYMEEISLAQMAQSCHYSTSYFSTLFKAQTGETFVSYLNRLRLEKACELLLTTNGKNADIAQQVGFSDPKYFNRLFVRQYGMPAHAYRKSARKGEER